MAAQSTTVASMYPAAAEMGPNRAIPAGGTQVSDRKGELTLVPARGAPSKLRPRQTAREEAVAIIPEMGWQELTDEALIARYRAEAGQAQAEQYINELFGATT